MYIRKPFIKTLFLAVSILIAPALCAMEIQSTSKSTAQATVFSFDLDDVITGKPKVGITDYLPLAKSLMFWHPVIVTAVLPKNLEKIKEHAAEKEKEMNGGSNIIHSMIGYLNGEGYGDLSYYENEMIEISQQPYPVMPMIEHARALRVKGRSIIGGTNEDYMQHLAYRKFLLANHGINLNEEFHAVLTTCVHHVSAPAGDGPFYRLNDTDNIYVTRDKDAHKPHESYFKILQQLAKTINRKTEIIVHTKEKEDEVLVVHTDDKIYNVEAAQKAGIKAIHFNLQAESVHKATPGQLQQAISGWEVAMREIDVEEAE